MSHYRALFILILLLQVTALGAANLSVECTQDSLLKAIKNANRSGGGNITFNCRDTTISMDRGLGHIRNNVHLDGQSKNIVLEYRGRLEGCSVGNNGVKGPPLATLGGRGGGGNNNAIRGLVFRNFLESIQVYGDNNVIADNEFLAHRCSDDAVSMPGKGASKNTIIRRNFFAGYKDKAIQMSFGSGTIEANTFLDNLAPIRGPYDNSNGGTYGIIDNYFLSSGNRRSCAAVTIDGRYVIHFKGNTLLCLRGLRVGGDTEILVEDNFIEGNDRVGIRLSGRAVASLSGNIIVNNGTKGGSLPSGGVVVTEKARADLGGGSLSIGGHSVASAGNNLLRGNGVANLRNLRPDYSVTADGNCWEGSWLWAATDIEGSARRLNSTCDSVPVCGDGICRDPENNLVCQQDCPPSCSDGVQNGNETGRDCGGGCSACPPTCSDGVRNAAETGIDCGGNCNALCPTCDDGIMNGDERGVDCGGSCPNPVCPGGIHGYLEAEEGTVRSPGEVVRDSAARQDLYFTSPVKNRGSLALPFTLTESGRYYFWVRVLTLTPSSDAIWFSLDDQSDRSNRFYSSRGMSEYRWIPLSDRGKPYSPTLQAGQHVIRFTVSEALLQLDALYFTNDAAGVPE